MNATPDTLPTYRDNAYERWLFDGEGRLVAILHLEGLAEEPFVSKALQHTMANKFIATLQASQEAGDDEVN